jgi:hypothetical protein
MRGHMYSPCGQSDRVMRYHIMHTLRYRTVSKNQGVILPGAARKSADVGSDKIIVL